MHGSAPAAISPLYYVDLAAGEVVEMEYTRDRATSVSPIFHAKKIDTLRILEQDLERRYYAALHRLRLVRKELYGDSQQSTSFGRNR